MLKFNRLPDNKMLCLLSKKKYLNIMLFQEKNDK